MGSRFYLRTLLLFLISSRILVRGQLRIPVEFEDEQLEKDIDDFFGLVYGIINFLGLHSFIAYTGNFDLKPSLEQRLMERFAVPVYTVGSIEEPLHHRYPKAASMVITLFSGLDDPTLKALNDTELSKGIQFYGFLYIPPRNGNRILTMDEMREFFSWCWERAFIRCFLCLRGESEFESWGYYYFTNVTVIRFRVDDTLQILLRRQGYRFLVQAANDPPTVFYYNSTEQADVIGGGNVSLSGVVGTLMVEFMRYLNASMDVLPIEREQSSNYEILEVPSSRSVDVVANLVENSSLLYSPVVADTQMCLILPHSREAPVYRYFDGVHLFTGGMAILVFAIKYLAHRTERQSLVLSFINTVRFIVGVPLPGGQLERLPLADKIVEVYCFLFVGILLSTYASLMSSAFTTGVSFPPITDAESLRASGLRIMTSDPTVPQAFRDNRLPSSLLDLVDVVDGPTAFKHFVDLNVSRTYVVRTPNWQGLRLYQDRLKNKRHRLAGPKLCSNVRHLRIPISPTSPLRFIFREYFHRVFEAGLQKKWLLMSFDKFRKITGLTKLPRDTDYEWKPLTLAFYRDFILIYTIGILLSILAFIMEILYKRYNG